MTTPTSSLDEGVSMLAACLKQIALILRTWPIFVVFDYLGRMTVFIGVTCGVIQWSLESGERRQAEHNRAWALINSARGSTGDGGRRAALEQLNADAVDLSGAPLAQAWLTEVKLGKAFMIKSDLRGAILDEAELASANMAGSDLTNASLLTANMEKANLTGACFCNANLTGAVLDQAQLHEADLSGANLTGAKLNGTTLSNSLLIGACIDEISTSNAYVERIVLFDAEIKNIVLPEDRLTEILLCNTVLPTGVISNRDCSQRDAIMAGMPSCCDPAKIAKRPCAGKGK